MSKEFPSQFGNAPQYRNPSGTIPMPQPKDIPAASWTQTRYRLDWGTPFAVAPNQANFFPEGWLWTVNWSSPFFDMRPDLRSSQGQVKEGVPMWRMGARLYVELIGQLLAPLGVQYGGEGYPVRSGRLNMTFTRFQIGPSQSQPAPVLTEANFLRLEAAVY